MQKRNPQTALQRIPTGTGVPGVQPAVSVPVSRKTVPDASYGITVCGSLGFDYIMNFSGRFADRIMPDKIHKISLSFLVDTLKREFGGTAGNIAYTLHLLGITPHILSVAGNDFDPYMKFLVKNGIDTAGIVIDSHTGTSSYFVVTDEEDNQIGSFFVGASKHAAEIKVTSGVQGGPGGFVMIAPTDTAAMCSYVRECRACGVAYMYDPAFQIGTFTPEELRFGLEGAHAAIGNDYEISLIEEKLGISHEELILMVPVLITTLGSKGSVIETKTESIHIKPAKPKNVSDPTGAGDAYRAGFLAGFVRGYDLPTCGRMGSVASVYTVEKYGTVTHTFTIDGFAARYEENYGESLPQFI
jgi:adenosine kinase